MTRFVLSMNPSLTPCFWYVGVHTVYHFYQNPGFLEWVCNKSVWSVEDFNKTATDELYVKAWALPYGMTTEMFTALKASADCN